MTGKGSSLAYIILFYSIGNVDVLYVFGAADKVEVFRTNANFVFEGVLFDRSQYFFGPGELNIVGRRAYFHIYQPSVSPDQLR